MKMIKQKILIFLWVLLLTGSAQAAWYNIQNTKFYVNGLPVALTEKERLKLIEVNSEEQTENNCKPRCDVLNKITAKVKIQQIIKAEAVATMPPLLTPLVDILKEMKSAIGFNNIRIAPTKEKAPASGGVSYSLFAKPHE